MTPPTQKYPWSSWTHIVAIQDHLHPGWRTKKPRTLFTTALASEVGGVCDQVTHLDGGGSQLLDPEKWSEPKVLHDLVDSWVMIVLVAERSGFTEEDFEAEVLNVRRELVERLEAKLREALK
jgi:hypothetical protein